MIIVSDTTPISELTKVGYLDILPALFGSVIVPEAVFEELQVGDHPAAEIIQQVTWIKVMPVSDRQFVQQLQEEFHLDLGESEAIALSEELDIDQVLIDEKAARKVATSRNLPLIGTMGVLILAKRRRLLVTVKQVLDAMRTQGTRISDRLYTQVLTLADEIE